MSNWIVTTENRGAIPEHFRPLVITGETGEPIIARLPDGRSPKDYANARLIAAAPALYEALKTAELQIENAYLHAKGFASVEASQTLEKCRAALALVDSKQEANFEAAEGYRERI